jgi:hypothetical protein
MRFVFAKSSRCLLLFSVVVRDDLYRCPVEGEACNPFVDEAYAPTDMNVSAIRSIRISSMGFSIALCSHDIHTRDRISWGGGQILTGGKVSVSTT